MTEATRDFELDESAVRQFYAEFLASTDLDAFARAHFAEDVVWENYLPANIAFGGAWRGRGAVIEYLNVMMQIIRIKAFTVDTVLVDGHTAAVFGSEESEVVTTGGSYIMDWVHTLEFADDGSIRCAREYNDTAAMQAAF